MAAQIEEFFKVIVDHTLNCANIFIMFGFLSLFLTWKEKFARRTVRVMLIDFFAAVTISLARAWARNIFPDSMQVNLGFVLTLLHFAVLFFTVWLVFENSLPYKLLIFVVYILTEAACILIVSTGMIKLAPDLWKNANHVAFQGRTFGQLLLIRLPMLAVLAIFALLMAVLLQLVRRGLHNHLPIMMALIPVTQLALYLFYVFDSLYPANREAMNYRYIVPATIVIIVACICDVALYYAVKQTRDNTDLRLRVQQADLLGQYYKVLEEQQTQIRELRHDLTNHIETLTRMANDGEDASPELAAYLQQLHGQLPTIQLHYCESAAVNALLVNKTLRCRELNIASDFHIALPPGLPVTDTDLVTMLSNMLDNAIEAAAEAEDKQVGLVIKQQANALIMVCENTVSAEPKSKAFYLDADKRGHGYGMKIIRQTAKKYGGEPTLTRENGRVTHSLVFFL